MLGQPNKSGRDAAALLATTFVFVGGLFACTFFAVLFSVQPSRDFYFIFGAFLGMAFLAWLLRGRSKNGAVGRRPFWMFWKPRQPEIHVQIKRVKDPLIDQYGTNKPPSVEAIRELSDTASNWTPKQVSNKQLEQEQRRKYD